MKKYITLTVLENIDMDTPHEKSFYISPNGEIVGWMAGKEPFTFRILRNDYRKTKIIEKIIGAWWDAGSKINDEDGDISRYREYIKNLIVEI